MSFTITKEISDKSWGSVNKTDIQNRLKKGLEDKEDGVQKAINEVYAAVLGNETPSSQWKMPHHELNSDGNVILNRAGVHAAYAALKGSHGNKPDLTNEQMSKALLHIKRHYKELKEDWPEDKKAKAALYTSIYGMPFEVDGDILDDLQLELEKSGMPNASNVGVGFSFLRSLPYSNGNGGCLTATCIKNSLDSAKYSQFDYNHEQDINLGTILGLKVYDDTDELIPQTPMRVFGYGSLFRTALREYGIFPDDLPDYKTSFEIMFNDYDFYYKGQVVLKEEAPVDWIENLNSIIEGIPYLDNGSRVNIIFGGVDEDASVSFSANSLLTVTPADFEAGILLAVANLKQAVFDKEEFNEMTYTEEQLQDKIKLAIAEMKTQNEKLQNDLQTAQSSLKEVNEKLQTAQASLTEKDATLKETSEKLQTAEASLTTEKERADKAEGELVAQATAALISERKQALASKGYPEDRIVKKEEWLGKASKQDFDEFLEDVTVLQSTAEKKVKDEFQAQASQKGLDLDVILNLTGHEDKSNEEQPSGKESENILL